MVLQNERLDCFTKMGKTSRWIRSLLGGKKEEKHKKYGSFSGENLVTATAIVPVTPKEKQRWSFGHKSSRALGSIVSTLNEDSTKQKNEQNFGMAVAVAATATSQTTMVETNEGSGKHSAVGHAAATKIQAIFRSYLVLTQKLGLNLISCFSNHKF